MDEVSGWPSVEDVAWIDVDDPSAPSAARRAAEVLATRLGMAAGRVADVGLAVTEIATNARLHGGGGALLLRAIREQGAEAALEVVAVDAGPGIADLPGARVDGTSTAGTLGLGLGAIGRLADSLDIATERDRGTVLVARFSQHRRAPSPLGTQVAGLTRAIGGEDVCGDAYAVRRDGRLVTVLLCDGSGHGPMAATAAQEAVRVFLDPVRPAGPPDDVLRRVHAGLAGTRGAAAGVAEIDADAATVRFAGVGNVAGSIIDDGERRRMVTIGGVAGHLTPTVRTFDYALPAHAVVVLHSDGLSNRWEAAVVQRLLARSPLLIAATLMREAAVHNDDACVVVGRVS